MNTVIRAVIIGITAVLLSTTLVSAPAQAAPVQRPVIVQKANLDTHWWGFSVDFNRSETLAIGGGAGSCAVVVGKLPSVQSKILSAGCGVLAIYAAGLRSSGRCLSVSKSWVSAPWQFNIGSRSC